jgi:hypothetical protein
VDFDAGDLVGRAALARALVATPEKEEEGLAIIESLYRDFPRSDPLAKTYAVLSKGNPTPEERFSIMATSLREGLAAGHWEVFWDAGDGFSEKRRKRLQLSVDTSGRSSLEVLLPAGVHRVRIDLPSQRSLFVRRPTLRLRGMADAPPMELWKEQLELHQMVRSKDELVSAGDVDPFFHFAVPASEGPVKILFAARVEVRLPRGLRAILLSPQAASVRAALVERGDETQVRRFDALKEQAGRQAEFEERP